MDNMFANTSDVDFDWHRAVNEMASRNRAVRRQTSHGAWRVLTPEAKFPITPEDIFSHDWEVVPEQRYDYNNPPEVIPNNDNTPVTPQDLL